MTVTREQVQRAAERVAKELGGNVTHHNARVRGPSTFEVIDRVAGARERSHGVFDTLDEARGCVIFDRLGDWEIWQGDHIVDESASD